jgi:uncharacterized protein (DUF934 family)
MRQIIRRREVVTDDWYYAGEAGAVAERTVVPLAQFLQAVADGSAPVRGAAVRLAPTDDPGMLAPYLARCALVVVDFPTIGDGRGFSIGRLLSQRYGFTGELRAAGALKRDQLYFLARCGFDAFDLDPAENLQEALAAFDTFSVAYQDGSRRVVQPRLRGG